MYENGWGTAADPKVAIDWYTKSANAGFGYTASIAGATSYTNQLNYVTQFSYDAANRKIAETNANLEVIRFAYDGANDLKRLYMLSIAAARRTLDICSPYFLTDESSRWELTRAIGRGVRIRILVEGDITDAKPVKYSSRDAYQAFMEQGIEIYEYQPTMMHTKALIVDGVWSMFGSANFDNRSLELNDEMNVAVSDPGLAARLLGDFEQDLRSARKLDLNEWRRRAALEKIREYFWSYFGEVF